MKQFNSIQAQLWAMLQTKQQKDFLAKSFRNIKKRVQMDISYAILAYLKWNVIRTFEDKWKSNYFKSIILFFDAERKLGKI